MTELQRQVQDTLREALADLDAALDYAKQKGAPAPLRTRMRAVRAKIASASYIVNYAPNKSLLEAAIKRFVSAWAKVTGRGSNG